MRSQKFILGLAVLGLVVASCGGSDKGSDATAPNDTSATDSGDRDRNVRITDGWGEGGAGFTQTKVADSSWINTSSSIFVRPDTTPGSSQSASATFVTVAVTENVNDTTTSTFVINGFEKTSPAEFAPLQGFGTSGVVRIPLAQRDANTDSTPSAWTIVSRQLAVLMFESYDKNLGTTDLVEFYDLASGNLATTYGDNGRITLTPGQFGLDYFSQVALRQVDSTGLIHLAFLGERNGADERTVKVVGMTANGKVDRQVGPASDGVASLDSLVPDELLSSAANLVLADHGIEPSLQGAIGVAMKVNVPVALGGDMAESINENAIATVIMKAQSDGRVTADPATTVVAKNTFSVEELSVESAAFSDNLLQVLSSVGDGENKPRLNELTIEPGADYVYSASEEPEFVDPNDDTQFARYDQTATVGASSGWLGSSVVEAGSPRHIELQVCFVREDCFNRANKSVLKLADVNADFNVYLEPVSTYVDGSEYHVVIKKVYQDDTPAAYELLSYDATGKKSSERLTPLTAAFNQFVMNDNGEAKLVVSEPAVLAAGRVAGVMSAKNGWNIDTVRLDNPALDTSVKSSPAIESFIYSPFSPGVIGGSKVLARVVRPDHTVGLAAVDASTGKIDASFGSGGLVDFPLRPEKSYPYCYEFMASAAGGAALEVMTDQNADEQGNCLRNIQKFTWVTLSAQGKVLNPGGGPSKAQIELDDQEEWRNVAGDANGNLYVVTTGWYDREVPVTEFDEAGNEVETTRAESVRAVKIRRYKPSGEVDPTFGKAGWVELSQFLGPQFDSLSTAIATVDAVGNVYISAISSDNSMFTFRFNSRGYLDHLVDDGITPTTTSTTIPKAADVAHDQPGSAGIPTPTKNASTQAASLLAGRISQAVGAITGGFTLQNVQPSSGSLTVSWTSAPGIAVTATALPSGQSCTSEDGKCTIAGLDPSQGYSIVLAKQGDPTPSIASALTQPIKPVFELKVGKSVNLKSVVKPASKGKATWKVTGGCAMNAAKSKVTAPKIPTTCQLSVTTAKDGKTPKTTKSVTISVTK